MSRSSDEIGDYVNMRTTAISYDLTLSPSSLSVANPAPSLEGFPTSSITLAQLLWIQRLILGTESINRLGLRNVDVWIGGETPEVAIFKPMQHSEVHKYISILLASWSQNYALLIAASFNDKLLSITSFHYEFLKIHPFLDGNGRVARALLEQQIKELMGVEISSIFTDRPSEYYECLKRANEGELQQLKTLIGSYITI